MQNKKINAFEAENKRDFYARSGNYIKFKKLYNRKIPTITNKNTGLMWDDLNFSRAKKLTRSHIYIDKIRQIINLIENKNGTLLDIGFGNGTIERELKKENLDLFGIDISKKSVIEIKKKIYGTFKKGDILHIPFESKLFDFILCLDVLEHISPDNTFDALREVNRVSKPNSTLIISVPMNEGLEKMINQGTNPNAHVRIYTPAILMMELKISGFAIEKKIFLSAFDNGYMVKKFINQILKIREPNLLILLAKKK